MLRPCVYSCHNIPHSLMHNPAIPLLNPRRAALLVALVTLVASVYMITYSGRIQTGDELYLFDAVGSFVDFNDFLLDLSAGTRPPQSFETDAFYPLPPVDAEPLHIFAAAPLYWLTEQLPGFGLIHTAWLLNILVSALACGVLFLYALALGYSERAAVLAGLALGFCTVVWPYSKTFFREPITMLMLLLAALLAERWRAGGYRSLPLLVAMIAAIAGMLLAKATALLALPALLLIAMPTIKRANRRVLTGFVAAAALAAALFLVLALFGDQLGVGRRYNPVARFIEGSGEFFPVALHTYLLSIGGSIWGTSPVGLLALPGLWMLYRQGKLRQIAVVLAVVFGFAVGYAALSGGFWFGGLSWPPRFLVPAVPFMIVGALPALERLTRRPLPVGLLVAAVVLAAYSLWIQITGVALEWGHYVDALPPEANGLLEWGGGLNTVRYLRWFVIPQLWSSYPLNFVWTRVDVPLWTLGFGALALVCAALLAYLTSRDANRRITRAAFALPLVLAVFAALGIRSIYRDPFYAPDRAGLFPILSIIEAETEPGDVVILSNREYENFFLNYAKLDGVRFVGLPPQPGDRPSETQLPEVVHHNPDRLLTNLTIPLLHSLAAPRERLWLLENKGPDFAWAVRPVEQFMATHYYPVRVIQTDPPDPTVRLIEYSTVDAPQPYSFVSPSTLTDFTFGDAFRLVGYTLPAGTRYQAGDLLPVSFWWRADAPMSQDVRIAWFLRAADGSPVAQGTDSRPRGDFEQTSAWPVGVPVWDNRALRIPEGTPPGTYQLWVKVYALDETFTPRDLSASGGAVLDEVIAVLPTSITIE